MTDGRKEALEAIEFALNANGLDYVDKTDAESALNALIKLYPSIAQLIEGTGVVVPVEPTEAMLGAMERMTGPTALCSQQRRSRNDT